MNGKGQVLSWQESARVLLEVQCCITIAQENAWEVFKYQSDLGPFEDAPCSHLCGGSHYLFPPWQTTPQVATEHLLMLPSRAWDASCNLLCASATTWKGEQATQCDGQSTRIRPMLLPVTSTNFLFFKIFYRRACSFPETINCWF